MSKHDEVYKQLFSHPEFVQQLIEAFAPQELAQNLDFSTLENHSGEYVTPNLRKRSQDLVWSAKLVSGEPLYLFILLEFQSKNDYSMPVRMLHYVAALYDRLIKNKQLKLHKDRLPLVFPLVLYGGENAWKAALCLQDILPKVPSFLRKYQPRLDYYLIDEMRLGQEVFQRQQSILSSLLATKTAQTKQDWQSGISQLSRVFNQNPQSEIIRRSVWIWLRSELQKRKLPANLDAENFELEVEHMALQTFDDWKLEWFAEGKEAGMQKGVGKGRLVTLRGTLEKLLRLKFRTVDEHFLQRIAMANEQELELWTERVLFADSLEAVFAA